jgi:hypothetical protein
MYMNILYYGNGQDLNKIILDNLQIKHQKQNYYKNTGYIETPQYLIFPSINKHILQFIKSIISTSTINKIPRTIILLNIDNIDEELKYTLRIILERYSLSTRFIATTNKISKIDKPIISRFFLKRQPTSLTKITTPLHKINYKPTPQQINLLTKKCNQFEIKDIVTDLLEITAYKTQLIHIASDLEHEYSIHHNKHLCIEALLLHCFYPPTIYKGNIRKVDI